VREEGWKREKEKMGMKMGRRKGDGKGRKKGGRGRRREIMGGKKMGGEIWDWTDKGVDIIKDENSRKFGGRMEKLM
jgi:hypothetical protein